MAKSLLLVLLPTVVCAIILAHMCSGLALLGNKHKHNHGLGNGSSLLKCEHGKLHGALEFIEFIEKVTAECHGPPLNRPYEDDKAIALYYTCLTEITGMTDADGTPNVDKIDAVNEMIYSSEILNNLPSFRKDLHHCALEFETNYNRIEKQRESGAETYFKCFGDAVRESVYMIGGDFDKVCSTKEKIIK